MRYAADLAISGYSLLIATHVLFFAVPSMYLINHGISMAVSLVYREPRVLKVWHYDVDWVGISSTPSISEIFHCT